MTLTEFALVLAHVVDPAPYAGYGWQIEEQLDRRARAAAARQAAGTDDAWREAQLAIIAAESQLARLFDVAPRPPAPLDTDDDYTSFLLELWGGSVPDDDKLTCEACGRHADDRQFAARAHGEIDDDICDECLTVQADTARWDAYNAHAYYHR